MLKLANVVINGLDIVKIFQHTHKTLKHLHIVAAQRRAVLRNKLHLIDIVIDLAEGII